MREQRIKSIGGFVYVMATGPFVKIGYSSKPLQRLVDVQIGCPTKVELECYVAGGRSNEKEIHICLRDAGLQEHGEWYRRHKVRRVVEAIADEDLCAAIAEAKAIRKRRLAA